MPDSKAKPAAEAPSAGKPASPGGGKPDPMDAMKGVMDIVKSGMDVAKKGMEAVKGLIPGGPGGGDKAGAVPTSVPNPADAMKGGPKADAGAKPPEAKQDAAPKPEVPKPPGLN